MKKIIAIITVLFITGLTYAQTAISGTGGEATGAGGTSSYTVGQVAYTTHTGTSGSVAQGVQQPYEIYVVTTIENAPNINLVYKAYPNPVQHSLTLSIPKYEGLSFQLFDVKGKQLQTKKIVQTETSA